MSLPTQGIESAAASQLRVSQQRILRWGELQGCGLAYHIARFYSQHQCPLLLIVADTDAASRLYKQLQFFLAKETRELLLFPSYETLVYDRFSPSEDILASRLSVLSRLCSRKQTICIVALPTLLQRLVPHSFIENNSTTISVNDQLEIEDFRSQLYTLGYSAVSQVRSYGDYALRGAIIDFFSPPSDYPTRIDLWDDRINSLRYFSPEHQQTIETIHSATLLPMREFSIDSESIESFRYKFRSAFSCRPDQCYIYSSISESVIPAGVEYYLPLFHDTMATLFDYLSPNTICVYARGLSDAVAKYLEDIEERYRFLSHSKERALLEPTALYLDSDELLQHLENFDHIETQDFKYQAVPTQSNITNFKTHLPPPIALDRQQKQPASKLEHFVRTYGGRILVVAPSRGYLEQLSEILATHSLHLELVDDWPAFLGSSAKLCGCCADFSQGVLLDKPLVALLTYYDIVLSSHLSEARSNRTRTAAMAIQNIRDIELGCAIVHRDHGVGRFVGLETIDLGGYLAEFCIIEYADRDKLYVPVAALHLLSRYSGSDTESLRLDKLGGRRWQMIQRKAALKARDVAAELLDMQARRSASPHIHFTVDHADYHAFASEFPYTETPDQNSAIDDVLRDMSRAQLMDRIVCGDVGFGKTEVAMRAAFIAVHNRKQVAILVPTTLLAVQHCEAFRERFAKWPVRIAMMSRFVSPRSRKRILADLQTGQIDIIIATHILLRASPDFADLGLVVIDEEHCFGAVDKEKIKSLRTSADVLTLTATPIPRTLSMSLGGLRDLSVIATPPLGRRPIKTFVTQWDDVLIREACSRELRRGGQIFFLHNEVRTIDDVAQHLRSLFPKINVAVAHGQMPGRELEQVMLNFYNHNNHILVCTTIIESGIDIPNANTIVINRADRFGLAQLHQLRGRVGRSHHIAYAYLLIPSRVEITADANKRLAVIESLEDLSIGFTIANHDLEIRGAGELLGAEQSGHIQKVGFVMYNNLLKRAVEALKSGLLPDPEQPLDTVAEIDLGEPALIPSCYIDDVNLRLVLYRRIAAAAAESALEVLKVEMIDRFGVLPEYTKNLYTNALIRIMCHNIGIRKLIANDSELNIYFEKQSKIDWAKLITMLKSELYSYRFTAHQKLLITGAENNMPTMAVREAKIKDFIGLLSLAAPSQ